MDYHETACIPNIGTVWFNFSKHWETLRTSSISVVIIFPSIVKLDFPEFELPADIKKLPRFCLFLKTPSLRLPEYAAE